MTSVFAIGALYALAVATSEPQQLLSRLNSEALRSKDNVFITCICIKLTPNGQMIVANAGHLSPYRNGEELTCDGGPPLGLFPDLVYPESRFDIDCGDTLILFSDGVTEARNASDEEFGFERTKALSMRSASEIASAAQKFGAQKFGQEDDITVVKLKYNPMERCVH